MTDSKNKTAEAGPTGKDAAERNGPTDEQIEHLLATANEAAGAARNAWLGFILVMAYLLVTIASTGHRDLLLNNPVTLPIVDVKLPLASFYVYAPLLFWLLHLGLFIQHAVTAKKLNALKAALAALRGKRPPGFESTIRGRLNHYSFAQYLAGAYGYDVRPESDAERTSAIHRLLMRLILWTSFVILPGLTFLYFQIGFLPYHDAVITWWQRALVIADVALLWAFWPIIRYDKPRWWDCFRSYPWPWKVAKLGATVAIVFLSLFVATLPGEMTDRAMANLWPAERADKRQIFRLTAWLFEGQVQDETLKPDSFFSRNLVVVQEDLVDDDEKLDEREVSLSLRGRNLRYSYLTASDLHRADLAHADLRGANLIDTNLQGANLNKANLRRADMGDATLDGANLRFANLRRAFLADVSARGADLVFANLQETEFGEADLQGANMRNAALQGANLHGTRLQAADLTYVRLHGANLQEANLSSADLRWAHLQGADLTSTRLEGADLRYAHTWAAGFPGRAELLHLADLRQIDTFELTKNEWNDLPEAVRTKLKARDEREGNADETDSFLEPPSPGGNDKAQWQEAAASAIAPPARELGASLVDLACGDTEGYTANGIVRRILSIADKAEEMPPVFAKMLLDDAIAETCAGREHLSPETTRRLRALAEETKNASDRQ